MANNRQLPKLAELAFKKLLQNDTITISSEAEMGMYKQFIFNHDVSLFLQSIADANSLKAQEFLDDSPELVVDARGTVKGASGYTYENHSAIELAYVMGDYNLMRNILLPAIYKLPPNMIEMAKLHLSNKILQIKEQENQFRPYDFSEIVKAISSNVSVREANTQNALAKFQEAFKPGNIKEGKSWIEEHLHEAWRLYRKENANWDTNQQSCYIGNVIEPLLKMTENLFMQEHIDMAPLMTIGMGWNIKLDYLMDYFKRKKLGWFLIENDFLIDSPRNVCAFPTPNDVDSYSEFMTGLDDLAELTDIFEVGIDCFSAKAHASNDQGLDPSNQDQLSSLSSISSTPGTFFSSHAYQDARDLGASGPDEQETEVRPRP